MANSCHQPKIQDPTILFSHLVLVCCDSILDSNSFHFIIACNSGERSGTEGFPGKGKRKGDNICIN